jgi:hypothetical protein
MRKLFTNFIFLHVISRKTVSNWNITCLDSEKFVNT